MSIESKSKWYTFNTSAHEIDSLLQSEAVQLFV